MTTPLAALDAAGSRAWNSEEAEAYCRTLAKTHYENFTVGSLFVPRKLRQHLYNVYAFCRWSDDLGDEVGNPALATQLLDEWEQGLEACYRGHARHPVYVALKRTIREFEIPKEPFWRLIQAFKQDQVKTRYPTVKDLLGYCEFSANPVGHLVLYLFGYRDRERQDLSDKTCTALQLANFWQDVARDMDIGRIYLPLEDLERFGVKEEEIRSKTFSENFRRLMAFQVERTRGLFQEGRKLADKVEGILRIDLEAFNQGGLAVLKSIERIEYKVLSRRPVVSRAAKLGILFRAALRTLFRP